MTKSVLGLVSKEVRNMHLDEIQTEKLLKAFSNGAMADTYERQAVVDAMNASVEANEAAQVRVGKAQQMLNDTAGKLMFSAEAMLEATDNKYMGEGSGIFHQKAGTAMKGQTLMDATRQQTSVYMNKLENTLMKYEQADLELADLVTLRQVRIEIILACEYAAFGDVRVNRKAQADSPFDGAAVHHRQRARQGEIDRTGLGVGLGAKGGGRAAEDLGLR